ncbi:MAG TPA: helix-turn-helix transcriptional regulator [Micromonosporaceae bacterium]
MPRQTVVDDCFPAELRRLRDERGLSLRVLADRAYVSKSTISELENGQKTPTVDTARALDAALQARGKLAELVTEVEPPRREPAVSPWESAELLERVRASDVSAPTVEALRVTVFELCCEYGWQSEQRLRAEGLRWLREVERLLGRPVGLRQHRELLVVAGWLALLVGCVEYDLGMRPAAEATRRAALQLGDEAGHAEISAWAWEMAAWFALTQDQHRDVVAAADAGQLVVGEHLAAVQLAAQKAKAYARMGDHTGVQATLDRGHWLLTRQPPPDRPDHHFVVDPDKWDFYAMDAYRIVGDDDRAAHHAREVLRLGTAPDGTERAPMRMAEARLTLAATAARAGELDRAFDTALTAFTARRRSLPTLLMVAGEVTGELRRRDPAGRRACELRDVVRAVSAG